MNTVEFELAFHNVAVKYVVHYATGTLPQYFWRYRLIHHSRLYRYLVVFQVFVLYKDLAGVRGSLNKFPDFFRMGTFIDSTHMKL